MFSQLKDKYICLLNLDSTFGKLEAFPDILMHYGWNPAKKLLQMMQAVIKEKTGNPDLTFMEVIYLKF